MGKVPNFGIRPDGARLVYIARFMHEVVLLFHCSHHQRTATVTVLLGVPLITTRICTLPVRPCGTTTLICHSPIYPGASPEYFTSPKALPIATHIEGWLFRH